MRISGPAPLGAVGSFLFGFREPVRRAEYSKWGLGLMGLKYGVDLALTGAFASAPLDPASYVNPLLYQRLAAMGQYPEWLPVVMSIWALPFIWVGISMTARRAVNAGTSPWLCLLFFLPVVNYVVIALLCAAREAPPRPSSTRALPRHDRAQPPLEQLRIGLVSVLSGGAIGALFAILSVFGVQQYGTTLFIGAPFVVGVITGVLLNRAERHSRTATMTAATLSVILSGGVLLLLALEGVLCLVMAAVLAVPLAILGALVGRAIMTTRGTPRPALSAFAVWPLLALLEGGAAERFPVRSTTSAIEIDAPPERVWPHVIGFSMLPPPDEWLMQAGVACPLRAHIVGEGVGAVRYCEFTTGAFVEPITVWDPPHRLAFDVTAQPPSMQEWSPYEVVHAPHLHGGFQSLRGEFALTPLPGGRTRLEGTTWYRLRMAPNAYWSMYGDYALHVIHHRVLSHIRTLSGG